MGPLTISPIVLLHPESIDNLPNHTLPHGSVTTAIDSLNLVEPLAVVLGAARPRENPVHGQYQVPAL